MPKFYIYKITFNDDSTYIGSHIQYKENDGYVCSSRYYQRHPELKIISREILFYLPTLEQMNVMETICIMEDKSYSPKNINGNYGNYAYNFHSKLDCPWNKGLKMSDEFKQKISEKNSEPIVCIETLEVFKNATGINHAIEVCLQKRDNANGLHYRKLTEEEIISGEVNTELNKAFLSEIYADKEFYYCTEYDIAFNTIDMVAGMLGVNPIELKRHFGKKYFGLTVIPVLGNILFSQGIKLIKKIPNERKTKKVKCVETNEIMDYSEAIKKYGNHISSCLNGKRKTCGGFHWERIEGEINVFN